MQIIKTSIAASLFVYLTVLLGGCSPEATVDAAAEDENPAVADVTPAPVIAENPTRNAYFGDLHVHTQYSFDAFIFGTRTDPDAAYRFAKGEAIEHPAGFEMQLNKPLDFQAVADHASFLGMLLEMNDPETQAGKHPDSAIVRAAVTAQGRGQAFRSMGGYFTGAKDGSGLLDMNVVRSAWQSIIASAERHNDPGKFTAFIGYEYTSSGMAAENLHRNVIFRGSETAELPFSRLDSRNPEKLWAWMDDLRDEGIEALAIPHNSNGSNGMMFETTDWEGNPIDAAYADLRMRNEPLVEITQVKGTSETHPALSPNDEWASFEIMPFRIASPLTSAPAGSYVRDAYLRGLTLEAVVGVNPYKFGIAAASDTHVSAGSFEESKYWSKVGLLDFNGQLRGSLPLEIAEDSPRYSPNTSFQTWGASGLTGAWAESNTRSSIYDAFRRKETFGTSGSRIRVRFFAGYDLATDTQLDADGLAVLYENAVAMGGDLAAEEGKKPSFVVWAARDSLAAPLQRMQIIKGWYADGEAQELVYDVACSDGATVDPQTHRCPDNGANVDLTDCSISTDVGAGELQTHWQDPDFDPNVRAFYYVRVLENPTCRWSTWDALAAGVAPRVELAATIQERAWTSPIWYAP